MPAPTYWYQWPAVPLPVWLLSTSTMSLGLMVTALAPLSSVVCVGFCGSGLNDVHAIGELEIVEGLGGDRQLLPGIHAGAGVDRGGGRVRIEPQRHRDRAVELGAAAAAATLRAG